MARTFNQVLAELWFKNVFVREREGRKVLAIEGGNDLPRDLQDAITFYREKLILHFSNPQFLQNELDQAKVVAENLDSVGADSVAAWDAYYKVLEMRKMAMPRPWARIKEDAVRCPLCPSLGRPADNDGLLCQSRCPDPIGHHWKSGELP